jgi:hypothetical protein
VPARPDLPTDANGPVSHALGATVPPANEAIAPDSVAPSPVARESAAPGTSNGGANRPSTAGFNPSTAGLNTSTAGVNPSTTNGPNGAAGCTAPQLRRFIKSRPYVPMHELRRRFGINGGEDDVTAVDLDGRSIFVGLPHREGQLLGELLRGGEVGYELSLDPRSPIVVGVYPMRPVPRH